MNSSLFGTPRENNNILKDHNLRTDKIGVLFGEKALIISLCYFPSLCRTVLDLCFWKRITLNKVGIC